MTRPDWFDFVAAAEKRHFGESRFIPTYDGCVVSFSHIFPEGHSTKDADAVLEKVIDEKIVQHLWEDFEAYRNAVNPPPITPSDSTSN